MSIVENPRPHGLSYNKWLGDQAKPSHREQLRQLIDATLEKKPSDLEELLKLLQDAGCEVTKRGKSINLCYAGWKKPARMDSLGDGYTKDDLFAVLSGKKEHTPHQKPTVQIPPKQVNLLVDIQAKLQAGKGAGYVKWAKVYNLKQMAQTMNYLSEHGLLDYGELKQKAETATARYNNLSTQIKGTETRMAEISVLRQHIINYAKTRDTYVAYRKAGYSKKFMAEHEADLLLHKAAKQAFEELGYGKDKKLPTVKTLQAEYAKLLEEKKKAYGEYRKARDEIRELLTEKANVDRILTNESIQLESPSKSENPDIVQK